MVWVGEYHNGERQMNDNTVYEVEQNTDSRERIIAASLLRVDQVNPAEGAVIAKHQIMALEPFRFMRGSASLFYEDLRADRLSLPKALQHPSLITHIVGDCHLSNFGFISEEGSHTDSVIFAPNDFDDACLGNAVWDILRFLTSLHLCTEACQDMVNGDVESEFLTEEYAGKLTDATLSDIVHAASGEDAIAAQHGFLKAYIKVCKEVVADVSYRQQVITEFDKSNLLRKLHAKAMKRTPGGEKFQEKSALAKLIVNTEHMPVFNFASEKLETVSESLASEISSVFRPYVDDEILDIAQRVGAGTGSVNMRRYYLLVGPKDYQGVEDLPLCHLVEVKQQRVAAPVPVFPNINPVNQLNPAHLTVVCQQRMQRNPDLVLDEVEWQGAHWLVRSRHHARVGIKPEHIAIAAIDSPVKLLEYAKSCGAALALAHSRGDRRSTRFEQAMLKRLPKHIESLIEAADMYAQQTAEDCMLLRTMLQR